MATVVEPTCVMLLESPSLPWRAFPQSRPSRSNHSTDLGLATAPGGDRHGLCLLRSIAPAGQDWHQNEYRLTDALSEISIRPSRSSHFLSSKVRFGDS
jgi:hypothetical protein